MDLPDCSTRQKILEVTLRDNRLSADVNLTRVAAKLEGYSGSDVKEVCREAVVRIAHAEAAALEKAAKTDRLATASHAALEPAPLREVCAADFDAAVAKLSSSVSQPACAAPFPNALESFFSFA